MKKKTVAVLLCTVLAASMLSACGKKESEQETSVSSQEEQKETLENGLPADAETMEHVLQALAVTSYETGSDYAVWDDTYFWNVCGYLINEDGISAGAEEKDDSIVMSQDSVKEYANALFGAYDGNVKDLPDIPETMENVSFDETAGEYTFQKTDTEEFELEVNSCIDNQDGTYEITGTLSSASGEKPAADFTAGMQETSYEGKQDLIYHYMVTTFEITQKYSDDQQEQTDTEENDQDNNTDSSQPDDNNSQNGNSQNQESQDQDSQNNSSQGNNSGKQISKDQALALVEKEFGADGEEDPSTGYVNTYGYEGTTTINGKKYYNFRMSWLVEDHVSYLNNIFVSMDGSEILEGGKGSDGGWEIY